MKPLVEGVDYILYYPPSSSSYGYLQGNGDKIPKNWVNAGDKIVSNYTCETKAVYCSPDATTRVFDEVILPSRKAAYRYEMPYT
jgi:hypothetical protein